MKRLALLLFVCIPNVWASDYAGLLSDYVKVGTKQGIKGNLVDYDAWAKDPRHKQAVAKITNPAKKTKAFWINAYNLLTIDLIVKTGERKSIKNQGTFLKNVWKTHKWKVGGKTVTLHQIEHDILRKTGDARIHYAINCASLSCPDLRPEPYRDGKLNQQLNDQQRKFLNNKTKGVRGKKISKIFDWFDDDFGGRRGIEKIISQKFDGYLDYNWNLNKI